MLDKIVQAFVLFQGVWQRSDIGPSHDLQEEQAHKRPAGPDLPERDWPAEGDHPGGDPRGHGVRAPVQKQAVELHHPEAEHEEDTHERSVGSVLIIIIRLRQQSGKKCTGDYRLSRAL